MSITKPLPRAPSLSFCSFSDGALDLTDDPAGVTRSSLTQESYPSDSCGHTLASSLDGSLQTLSLHPRLGHFTTPPEIPVRVHHSASVHLPAVQAPRPRCPSTLHQEKENAEDAHEAAAMDMFDLALAQDAQERRRRHATPPHAGGPPCGTSAPSLSTMRMSVDLTLRHLHRTTKALAVDTTIVNASSSVASARRETQIQHVKSLLRETRHLHEALWEQLQRLQRQENADRQERRGHRDAYAR